MTNKLEVSQPQKTGNLRALASLFVALLAMSSSGIFVRLSEGEISSNATVFDRVAIATIVFGFWNGLNAVRHRMNDRKPVALEFDTIEILTVAGNVHYFMLGLSLKQLLLFLPYSWD